MKIKSYFARTVEDAMAQAGQELGPDAMLLNSRRAPAEARHLGDYEVVFATGPTDAPAVSDDSVSFPNPGPSGERLSAEVAELKKELEGMRRTLTRAVLAPAEWAGAPPDISDAYARLTAADVTPELAREILDATEARLQGGRQQVRKGPSRAARSGFQKALVEELQARFTTNSTMGRGEIRPAVTALVGPPGAGKTSTLIKLAVNYGLASRRPCILLSLDTYRIAAAEQLRTFASILGVACQVLETTAALAQALEENRGKDLILIDTPGYGFGDLEEAVPLAQFLSTRTDIDTQLVLPASMKPADLPRIADSFHIFRPKKLIFTRLDETGSFGPILSEAARTERPISFFSTGQRIPEDLEEATSKRLIELILAGHGGRAVTAA
jgi:flagellar biosynthesis protein FlhF